VKINSNLIKQNMSATTRRIHVRLWGGFVLFRGCLFDLGANAGARGPLFRGGLCPPNNRTCVLRVGGVGGVVYRQKTRFQI
jgi:hypothetical protein